LERPARHGIIVLTTTNNFTERQSTLLNFTYFLNLLAGKGWDAHR
jgi:hypothetical protein